MTEELPSRYDHKESEPKIYELWEKSGCFRPENLPASKTLNLKPETYSIHLPPPNITGSLHMGHALNATISDILVRFHRMSGHKTVWFPGIDHAGIATQNVVEKELKKEGVSRWDLGREEFLKRVWQWKEKYGGIILDQLKKLGASADWSRTRFTMDENYAAEVRKAFIHYYGKGLIYRGKRVVNWCPRCGTSLSDLEILYKEEKTSLWYIKYPLAENSKFQIPNSKFIIVATTRPETMLGDAAVAVNPNDKRYEKLVGKNIVLPIQSRKIPIVTDAAVEMEFGTGAVKVTPAHDILDSEIAARHKLPFYQVIDEIGKMTKEAGDEFSGMKTKDAREMVVKKLNDGGFIEKIENYVHNLATCYRCNSILEPLLSNQWFIKMDGLAKTAADAARSGKVKILPEGFRKIYFSWLENIKDWCISRQLWWGHQIPAWFHEPKCVPKTSDKRQATRLATATAERASGKNMAKCKEMIVSAEKPICQYCDAQYVQSEDVLDTWFSSALWPFAGLSQKDIKEFYPSNVLITARDIINLWVGRMIFSGMEFTGKEPFPEVLIHATILTKDGKRMSKSMGTGIDPLALIEANGADATRFGLIWQIMGNQDVRWDETAVIAGKKFVTKFWNVARFVIAKTGGARLESEPPQTKTDEDAEILKKLSETKKQLESDIKEYRFGQGLRLLYDFIWHDLADKYVEHIKDRNDDEVKKTMSYILRECLIMLHPFAPFVTEEIYQKFEFRGLLMVEKW